MTAVAESCHQPLYMRLFGFNRNPFPVTPDPGRYYAPQTLLAHLAEIMHFLETRKGFLLVTGDVGIGKTTLVRKIISDLDHDKVCIALLFNTFLQGSALIESINKDFGVKPEQADLIHQLEALNNFLLAQFVQGKNCIIIIDDAQNLSIESLELVRQLSNLETDKDKLIQILLIAQPEILTTLDRPEIRQLRSRIALHCKLQPFSRREVASYIDRCLTVAGKSAGITLTAPAIYWLTHYSRGYPRIINLLMDRCLYGLLAYNRSTINARLVREAVKDLVLLPQKKQGVFKWFSLLALCVLLASGYLWSAALPNWLAKLSSPTVQVISDANQRWRWFLTAYGLERYLQTFPVPDVDTVNRLRNTLARETDLKVALIKANSAINCVELPVFEWQDGQKLALYHSPVTGVSLRVSAEIEDTRIVQAILAKQGLLAAANVDGIMGRLTQQALTAFQQRAGLALTGQVDDETAYALSCAKTL